MLDSDEGRATLKGLSDTTYQAEVEYSITFINELRTVRSGLNPVAYGSAKVKYIRRVDGQPIPEGEYLLLRPQEKNRVKNLGFGGWHVLSWPRG